MRRFESQRAEGDKDCELHNGTSCEGWELYRELESKEQWGNRIHFVGNITPMSTRDNPNQGRVYMTDGVCPTLTGMTGGGRQPHVIVRKRNMGYKVRKITPREAFRLMGASDEDFERASEVASNTGLYKTAGNGIVVSCLEAIFRQMNIKGVEKWNKF